MDVVTLANDRVRFAFDRATGSLVAIEDRIAGVEHIREPAGGRLFRVVCPSDRWLARYADSHEAGPPEIVEEALPDGGRALVLRWARLRAATGDPESDGAIPVAATVRVVLPAGDTEARFTLELKNEGPGLVHEAHFPWVGGWTRDADVPIVCGCTPVKVGPRPGETFSYNLMAAHRRRHCSYLHMQLPFVDLSANGHGISYICYQERPALGGVLFSNLDPEPAGFVGSFAWTFYAFVRPGVTWRSPAVGISIHAGDWHTTADRFRAWLDTWWQPPRPPERLATKIGWQIIQTRGFDGQVNHRWRDIPKLAAAGLAHGIADLCVWDPIAGVYLRPDDGDFWEEYDPAQSLADLRTALAAAKAMGANVSTLVNYRLIRAESALYARIEGERQVQRTLHGAPVTDEWSTCTAAHASFRTGYLGKLGVALCQRSPAFRRRALAITEQTLDLGFTSLFIDQAFDYNPCFAADHGHRSPDDTHEAAVDWLRVAYPMVRSRDPQAYVIGETTDVHGAQYLDLQWNWGWEALLPEVMRYTLPETLHCWVVDHQPGVLARAFAMGFLVAFTTSMAERPIDKYPLFADKVARLAALRERCAPWTIAGRFRDKVGLDAGNAVAYAYDASDGIAVALAETTGKPRHAEIVLDPAAHGRTLTGDATLYREDGSDVATGEALPDGRVRLAIDLAPHEAAIWTVPCA